MGKAKDIEIKVISSKSANNIIKKLHYSGKVVPNSQLHFGVFLEGKCGGCLSFGPSINKKGTINLVKDTKWNDFLELNRMALADWLPRNGESRSIGLCLKYIKKHYPNIKWVVSFADGTQCGDGTIYRASNFVLTGIAVNTALRMNPKTGEKMHIIQAHHKMNRDFKNWKPLIGYQFRYIYFIDRKYRKNLTVPEIPFSKIDELNAGMYKGESISIKERRKENTDPEQIFKQNEVQNEKKR